VFDVKCVGDVDKNQKTEASAIVRKRLRLSIDGANPRLMQQEQS
jgi:hypothetical protein